MLPQTVDAAGWVALYHRATTELEDHARFLFDRVDGPFEHHASRLLREAHQEARSHHITQSPEPWLSTEEASKRLNMDRDTLDKMAATAPPGLAGGPLNIGQGTRRRWRWDPATLNAWVAAYQQWKVSQVISKSKPTRTNKPRAATPPAGGVVDWGAAGRGR